MRPDHHLNIAVVLPTTDGAGSLAARTLMPLAGTWTADGGTRWFEPAMLRQRTGRPDTLAGLASPEHPDRPLVCVF